MTKTIQNLYQSHIGKISDKWESYLAAYHFHFETLRNREINLLEIGVQNGGSLDIWAKYFPKANTLVGCDIDANCGGLVYEDKRISVVVGDICDAKTQEKIFRISQHFDLIIDDGSHHSGDIIRAFIKYFKCLSDGGIYVAEDLHCSYWKDYEGGCYHPYSSISFFKSLVDVINSEYWGNGYSIAKFLSGFEDFYGLSLSDFPFNRIESLEFSNSLCFIKKSEKISRLGQRIVVGNVDIVEGKSHYEPGSLISVPNQKNNIAAYQYIQNQKSEAFDLRMRLQQEHLQNLSTALGSARDELTVAAKIIDNIYTSYSWRLTKPLRLINQIARHPFKAAKRILSQLLFRLRNYGQNEAKTQAKTKASEAQKIDIQQSIHVLIHAFYPESLIEILDYLMEWKFPYQLYITTTVDKESIVRDILDRYGMYHKLLVCPNKGRDVLPFLKLFESFPINSGIVLKLHTKRSLHRTDGDAWRKDFYEKLLSSVYVKKILKAFNDCHNLGIVIPEGTYVSMHDNIGDTESIVRELADRILGRLDSDLPEGFSAGTMFYIRRGDLQPILDLELSEDHFQEEATQIDGTMAHALERLFFVPSHLYGHFVATNAAPYNPASISNSQFNQRVNW